MVLCLTAAAAGRADIVYSTYVGGPGVYNHNGSFQTVDDPIRYAVSFIPTVTSVLDSISVTLTGINPAPAPTALLTLTFDGGNNPGAQIESWTVSNFGSYPSDQNGELVTVTSTIPTLLVGGQRYWVIATPPTGMRLGWYDNALGTRGGYVFSNNGGPWFPGIPPNGLSGVMEVTASVVPESGRIGVVGAVGLMASAYAGRRRLSVAVRG